MAQAKHQPIDTHAAAKENKAAAQARHLEEINTFLAVRDLAPIARTGDKDRHETELVGIARIGHENPWYSIIGFDVLHPDGRPGQFFLRFQAQGAHGMPMIVLPMVNDHLVFVYQHRAAVSRWLTEAPRQFAKSTLEPSILDRKVIELAQRAGLHDRFPSHGLPLGLLGREAVSLMLGEQMNVLEVVQLDDGMPEDSGYDTTQSQVWFVRMELGDPSAMRRMRGTNSQGIRFYPVDEVRRRRRELHIRDKHTLSALYLLFEHLGMI